MSKNYVVRHPGTKKIICEGDAQQCADALGFKSKKMFYNITNRINAGMYKKYLIDTDVMPMTQTAIDRWNAFTDPLRKKYGIPRYRGD